MDDTLLGDDHSLGELTTALHNTPQIITAYNSSRPCASLWNTLSQKAGLLPVPDYLIGAMGTEIQTGASSFPLSPYAKALHDGWNRSALLALCAELNLTAHPAEYQTALKASFDVPNEATFTQLSERITASGLRAKLIFSSGRFVDIIPEAAGKGAAIHFLHQYLKIPAERVIVAGDSGNDLEMFTAGFSGIVVANADESLKQMQGPNIYHAQKPYAAGVLEGLQHWGLPL